MAQLGGNPRRVKLIADFSLIMKTANLKNGAEGVTIPNMSLTGIGGGSDYVAVKFDSGENLDTHVECLEFLEN